MSELLDGIARRFATLDIAQPSMAIVDNCCMTRTAIQRALPRTEVKLDVFHFKQRYVCDLLTVIPRNLTHLSRYMVTILNGVRNSHYRSVGSEISGAIIKTPASNGKPTTYWSQPEQEERLVAMWDKWLKYGGIWSAASTKVCCTS